MKITTLEQAKAYIKTLEAERDALRLKAIGHRSDGTIDKYTDMEAAELRALIERRGGDPDEIAKGAHSRGRSVLMRQWLRSHPGKGAKAEPVKSVTKKPKRPPEPPPVAKKRKPKVVEAPPARKPKKAAKQAGRPAKKAAAKPGKRKAM
jgi:hypothetical protein